MFSWISLDLFATLTFLISLKNIFLQEILLTFDNYDKFSFDHFSLVKIIAGQRSMTVNK